VKALNVYENPIRFLTSLCYLGMLLLLMLLADYGSMVITAPGITSRTIHNHQVCDIHIANIFYSLCLTIVIAIEPEVNNEMTADSGYVGSQRDTASESSAGGAVESTIYDVSLVQGRPEDITEPTLYRKGERFHVKIQGNYRGPKSTYFGEYGTVAVNGSTVTHTWLLNLHLLRQGILLTSL
jgi:hypothetical protein